ncbi:baseplate J/gp47 family protein [Desulfobacter vibrioformis]|uniref:baseplate J/gp47 family protein n=1 Tax=Desulfobacter vibrioformis TaxID=34031 RepID=UPI00054D70D4|nr:baseplate J/gp47 family protein [Desulfobacter vibrioformis]
MDFSHPQNEFIPFKLDSRTEEEIYRDCLALARLYCSEWANVHGSTPDPRDFGLVLFNLFAKLTKIVTTQVNQIPEKQLLTFYDFLGMELYPAKPADALLTFGLSEKCRQIVHIPTETRVASSGNPKVIFETVNDLDAVNLPIQSAFLFNPDEDAYQDITSQVQSRESVFSLFPDKLSEPVQFPHILYLTAPDFCFKTPSDLTLRFSVTPDLLTGENVTCYFNQWSGSETAKKEPSTIDKITFNGKSIEIKFKDVVLKQTTIQGTAEYWLQLFPHKELFYTIKDEKQCRNTPEALRIERISYDLSAQNLPFDGIFVNDVPVQAEKGFYLFGKIPQKFDTVYFGCREAFAPGSKVTMTFEYYPGVPSEHLKLQWEHWTGQEWQEFKLESPANPFLFGQKASGKPDSGKDKSDQPQIQVVEFTCPNFDTSKVNQVESRWIRIRIINGDYGGQYVPAAIDSDEAKKLQSLLDKELDGLTENWISRVFPDSSEFQIKKILNYGKTTLDSIVETVLDIMKKGTLFWNPVLRGLSSGLGLFIDHLPETKTIKERSNIIHFAGLAVQTLNQKFKELLGPYFNATQLIKKLTKQNWMLCHLEKCTPPYIDRVAITYEITDKILPQYQAYNNFSFAGPLSLPFTPYVKKEGLPGFYLGFDGNMPNANWNAYFALDNPKVSRDNEYHNPCSLNLTWEYFREDKGEKTTGDSTNWTALPIQKDETVSFRQSGIIAWTYPGDIGSHPEFNQTKQWIRVGLTPKDKPSSQVNLKGIYPNSVWSKNYMTVHDQFLGASNGEANQVFTLSAHCIFDNPEILVREAFLPDTVQMEIIKREEGENAILETENGNNETEIWIQWHMVRSLTLSGPCSRHYTLDREKGEIQFGNGSQGMIPPVLPNNIKAMQYQKGDRVSDIPAQKQLTKIQKAIPDVIDVTNYFPAIGGKGFENIREFLSRVTKSIKRRDRAVTKGDFQYLAQKASDLVCNSNCILNKPDEILDILIVPSSEYGSPYPGTELIDLVTEYVQDRALPQLKNNIRVTAPTYRLINVDATLTAKPSFPFNKVEKTVSDTLQIFFDPTVSQWNFGATIFYSQVKHTIQTCLGVETICDLTLRLTCNTEAVSNLNGEPILLKERELPYPGEIRIHENKNS